jgi:muramoyltetrapeptide carboxypeptidase
MKRPPSLRKGDRVGIVAPGRKVKPSDIENAVMILSAWGLEVKLATHLFSGMHSYLAGTDEQRLADLQGMLDDPSIKAIICARGGYGTTRILDRLDFQSFEKSPKWIAGFSDITALHLKLAVLGYESIHSTMPILFPKPDSRESVESLNRALFGTPGTLIASPGINRPGKATALVVGGNLSLIADALGTASEPDTDGKILIIEEIDEYRYRIDRMFTQLKRAGKLENLAGLVVGHFTDIKDTEVSFGETVEEIILHQVRDYSFPVGFGFPLGHENPNLAWIHGSTMQLSVSPEGAMLVPYDISYSNSVSANT